MGMLTKCNLLSCVGVGLKVRKDQLKHAIPNVDTAGTMVHFPACGDRIVVNGRNAFVFGCMNELPRSFTVLLAFDGIPVTWDRVDLATLDAEIDWSLAIAEANAMSDCEVHAVIRAASGMKLPEAFFLGPCVVQQQNDGAGGAQFVGWSLYSAYIPASQTSNVNMVATPVQQGSYRMGDHVIFKDLTPVSLSAKESVDDIPNEGSAIVYGFALGKDATWLDQNRRFVLLLVENTRLCLAHMDSIAPGDPSLAHDGLKTLLAQKSTLHDVCQQLLRSPSAVQSAMTRVKKIRAANLAALKALAEEVSDGACISQEIIASLTHVAPYI